MIHLELFYVVKHCKNTHVSKTKFVFYFHVCFESPWVFERFSKKPLKDWVFEVFCMFS